MSPVLWLIGVIVVGGIVLFGMLLYGIAGIETQKDRDREWKR